MKQTQKPAMPQDLRIANEKRILMSFADGKTLSAADVCHITGISRPTVMRALHGFLQSGALQSMGLGSASAQGGKKPELFAFGDPQRILCLSLWPDRVTVALFGMVGDVLSLETLPVSISPTATPEECFRLIKAPLESYLLRQRVSRKLLYGVALTVPGTVDGENCLLRYNSQSPSWGRNVSFRPYLEKLFGTSPIFWMDNAGKAAGRAVLLDEQAFSHQRVLTLFTTWGVSACMLDHGRVLGGRDQLIGEIGHMVIESECADGPACGCGKKGCLESLTSLASVRARMQKRGARLPDSLRDLFARAQNGDAAACEESEHLAHCFAVALHDLSLAYNQEIVIFQGDLAWADDGFNRALKEELRQFRYYPDGDFITLRYDRRDLALLASIGSAQKLRDRYFEMEG